MKQENETFNACVTMFTLEKADVALLKRPYASPTTVAARVQLEMDVLSTSVIETTGKISAGKSIDGGVGFEKSGFASDDYGSVDW